MGEYTIRAGDTLSGIAGRHGTSVSAIVRLNGIEDPDFIVTGDFLRLPEDGEEKTRAGTPSSGTSYTIRAGDTLSSIAARYGSSVAAIAQANGIVNPDRIAAGAQLRIPRDARGPGGRSIGPHEPAMAHQGSGPEWFRGVAEQAAARAGVPAEWARSPSLHELVEHESSFRPEAQNPSSTAYGLFQFLDSTWAGTGVGKTSDPVLQTVAGLRYIRSRYGTPEEAWAFWQRNNWY